MKPQAEILILSAFLYALAGYVQYRKIQRFSLLFFSIILFLGYNLYFIWILYPTQGLKSAAVLPTFLLNVTGIMPVLTANMLNIWYPVALVLKAPYAEIWTVDSLFHILPYIQARFFAAFIVVGLIAWNVINTSRKDLDIKQTGNYYFLVFAFSATVVPFLMTSTTRITYFCRQYYLFY